VAISSTTPARSHATHRPLTPSAEGLVFKQPNGEHRVGEPQTAVIVIIEHLAIEAHVAVERARLDEHARRCDVLSRRLSQPYGKLPPS
jgi:hypothetical protein